MPPLVALDYLVIGHVTRDLIDGHFTIGGTVSYAARTALALGCRVGIVTSAEADLDLAALDGVLIARHSAAATTTFKNIYTSTGRRQMLHGLAAPLSREMVPADWQPDIVHLGPVARECAPSLVDAFGEAFIGVTPQGWMRRWDEAGQVSGGSWESAEPILARADAVVLSEEDVAGDRVLISRYAALTQLLVVTQGREGCTVHTGGESRHFPAPPMREVDPTGAGDIFAAAFFYCYRRREDPWEAARFANCIAAYSVTRAGLDGTPRPEEVARCREILAGG